MVADVHRNYFAMITHVATKNVAATSVTGNTAQNRRTIVAVVDVNQIRGERRHVAVYR